MRKPVTEPGCREFMRAIAAEAREPGRIYLAGGASVVLKALARKHGGYRHHDHPRERSNPSRNPRLEGTASRQRRTVVAGAFRSAVAGMGRPQPVHRRAKASIAFHHFDFYTQALSKIERAHRKDLLDVDSMIRDGLVDPKRLLALFEEVDDQLYRYPALNPPTLRAAVERLASAALQ